METQTEETTWVTKTELQMEMKTWEVKMEIRMETIILDS